MLGSRSPGEGRTHPACPPGLVDHAPTPSFAPINWSLAYTASSPFVYPRMTCPFTLARRSRLRSCVLRGSENDPEGGDRKGGGNGLGALLANNASPVSNRKGGISLCKVGGSGVADVENVNSGRHLGGLWMRDRRDCLIMVRTTCGRSADLLIPALWMKWDRECSMSADW